MLPLLWCSWLIFTAFILILEEVQGGASIPVRPRVAFVFAGSPRSFIHTPIHESIRINLIQSFCPFHSCDAAVFARVSIADNVHQVNNKRVEAADGVFIEGDENDKLRIEFAANRLVKPYVGSSKYGRANAAFADRNISSSNTKFPQLVLEWTNVGSAEEKEAIKKEFPSKRHTILSTLDRRRYSMYFNRYKAYQMAVAFERENEMKFDWVVHARLDAAFGAPLDSVIKYYRKAYPRPNPGKNSKNTGYSTIPPQPVVHVHDTWYSDVPDTFALLPRAYSNAYYSVEALADPSVMCLGGPNFEKNSIEPANLAKTGLLSEVGDLELIQSMLCNSQERGYSEFILKKKLIFGGISLANGNIAYSTFFMVIVRTNMDDMCFYLEAGRLIGWVYNRQHSNSAIVMGCTRMMEQFKAIVANDAKIQKFENISTAGAAGDAASTTRQLQKRTVKPARGNNIRGFQKFYDRKSDRKKSSSASSLTVQERIHTQPCTRLLPATRGKSTVVVPSTSVDGEFRQFSCPMNYGFSEWNFMPFRFRLPEFPSQSVSIHEGNIAELSCISWMPTTTVNPANSPRSLILTTCEHFHTEKNGAVNVSYTEQQLFHLYPMLGRVSSEEESHAHTHQRIHAVGLVKSKAGRGSSWGCVTVSEEFTVVSGADGDTTRRYQLSVQPCHYQDFHQLFEVVHIGSVKFAKVGEDRPIKILWSVSMNENAGANEEHNEFIACALVLTKGSHYSAPTSSDSEPLYIECVSPANSAASTRIHSRQQQLQLASHGTVIHLERTRTNFPLF